MPLPAPNLDDLRFQRDLVDEARRRIIRYCPEWTDYNLSDPGITLIELFAWMTEMLVYRLNRVPERNYIKFLELMGIQVQPASSARTELTFYLSAPFPIAPDDETLAVVPRGLEVTTRPTDEEDAVSFTVDQKLAIAPPKLTQLRRDADFTKNFYPRLGVERFYAFNQRKPEVGDTFYLGFDDAQNIGGYILRLTFDCEETQAVGVRREDPPLVWECSIGDGQWEEVSLSTRRGEKDTTGGLNNPRGSVVMYLPLTHQPDQVHGRSAYWLRCRLEPRREEQGMYSESPRIKNIVAHVLGGTAWATHGVNIADELLGISNGEPGQIYHLQSPPVLALQRDETVEVEELWGSEIVFQRWERVAEFSQSDRYDRHFTMDEATGEICFGPAVRQPDGSIRQYGRVPEAGRRVRMTQYRCGGGAVGNVPAGRVQLLKSAVPYIDRVTNLKRAEGGRDQESLDELKLRARRELRAQQRAVTAEDFEDLSKGASRAVARVRCQAPSKVSSSDRGAERARSALPPGMIELLVVPAAYDSLRAGDLSKLFLEAELRDKIRTHLDQYRLLTTTLRIREPNYVGIKARVQVVPSDFAQPEIVKARVDERLKSFLSPLPIGQDGSNQPEGLGPDWEGWPFGRDLYVSEIFSLLQQVPGVKHVLEVNLNYRTVVPGRESPFPGADEEKLNVVRERVLQVPADTLLCSLAHEIEVVEL